MSNMIERLESRTLFANYSASTVTQLIAAINSANSSAAADTITLAAGATFSLTDVEDYSDGSSGLPRVTGGGLTIVGNGGIIARSSAAVDAFRFFTVAASASLTLRNLTLAGGWTRGSQLNSALAVEVIPARGGAIFSQGDLVLDGVTIRDSAAVGASGGHFWGLALPPVPAEGGAIYSSGALSMSGCTIRNNFAAGGSGESSGFSGGLDWDTITRWNASPAASGSGGAIFIAGGSASITGSTISSNTAQGGNGGGGTGATNGADGRGGGLFAAGGSVTLRTSTVTANLAQGGAGGIGNLTRNGRRNDGSPGSGIGGGLYFDSAAAAGLDEFTRSHVTRNTASTGKNDIAGRFKSIL